MALSREHKALLVKIAQHKAEALGGQEVEVDQETDSRRFSVGEDGVWVRAWVFVDNDEIEVTLTPKGRKATNA
jgi:hypothetical protein